MPIKEVRRHISGDALFVGLECLQVAVAHLRGDLEADVQELAEAGVVGRVALIVAQRGDELLAGPAVDGLGSGQLARGRCR